MRRLVATLVLAAATGALLAGTALAQPGSSESEDAPPAEAAACYAAPAETDRGTVTLVAHEACDASEAEAQGGDAPAAADDAAVTKRVGPLGILP
jgi:hypothetical protein